MRIFLKNNVTYHQIGRYVLHCVAILVVGYLLDNLKQYVCNSFSLPKNLELLHCFYVRPRSGSQHERLYNTKIVIHPCRLAITQVFLHKVSSGMSDHRVLKYYCFLTLLHCGRFGHLKNKLK